MAVLYGLLMFRLIPLIIQNLDIKMYHMCTHTRSFHIKISKVLRTANGLLLTSRKYIKLYMYTHSKIFYVMEDDVENENRSKIYSVNM